MAFAAALEQLPFSVWVRESPSRWAFPMFLFAHTLGMSVVAGGSAVIDLTVLGCWPKTPIKPLERLFPLIWIGFWLNLVTGTVMLIADAVSKLSNWDFYVKMVFVFAGVALVRVIRNQVFLNPKLDLVPVSASAKGLAWASLICWFGAILAGRLLAYVGGANGLGAKP